MQFNYYTLKRLSVYLKSILINSEWLESFSQQKDELIISLITQQGLPFYIRCTLRNDFSCLSFPTEYHKSRKNVVTLFSELNNGKILAIEQYENERAFSFHFDNGSTLLFKLFGNRSNIILIDNNHNRSLFKKKLVVDNQLSLDSLHRPIERTLENYRLDPNLNSFYPTFDKTIKKHLSEVGFESMTIDAQWEYLESLDQEMNSNPFLLLHHDLRPILSLIPLDDLPIDDLGEDVISALNQFNSYFTREHALKVQKEQTISELEKKVKQSENYIQKAESKLKVLENETSPSQLADILMANLHVVSTGIDKVTLMNFYDGKEVEIKLKKNLSPQKNAEHYYRKSKNRKIELETLSKHIEEKRLGITNIKVSIEEINTIESIKGLRKFSKQAPDNDRLKPNESKPYKEFFIDGFKVWVGKNAKSNDELTLKFSYKEDLWFHVKDIPGSHVLLKHIAGTNFSIHTIEKVAAIAAYYSKRKNDNHVPVIYTPAKFVRKRKRSLPGQVIVEREKVILVTPSLI